MASVSRTAGVFCFASSACHGVIRSSKEIEGDRGQYLCPFALVNTHVF